MTDHDLCVCNGPYPLVNLQLDCHLRKGQRKHHCDLPASSHFGIQPPCNTSSGWSLHGGWITTTMSVSGCDLGKAVPSFMSATKFLAGASGQTLHAGITTSVLNINIATEHPINGAVRIFGHTFELVFTVTRLFARCVVTTVALGVLAGTCPLCQPTCNATAALSS